ncbi:capsular biosynthesis protein [Aureimonas psammosilenae]|uniref:capsular biosynthesis protein n=1 Tax=Aureimonas psammosilenae TaxID=2495496 RepID=UPI00126050AB|nr:capsular biosynthesis protein [Aureimonas psammosilenae]
MTKTRTLLREIALHHPKVVVDEVDASPAARAAVARFFFDLDDVPMKAWNGSPLYSYLYGIWKTQADYVVHFDGDMFFGGDSATWLDEAVALLEGNETYAFAGPLPGPPRPDGTIHGHGDHWKGGTARRVEGETPTHDFDTVSTRIFVVNVKLLRQRLGGPLQARRPSLKERAHALLLGNSPKMIELERILSESMAERGLKRVDFLGSGTGRWSLHPPLRSPEFFKRLPELVDRVERGDLPEAQKGHYNMVDELIDFSEARRRNTRLARWRRHAANIAGRLQAVVVPSKR